MNEFVVFNWMWPSKSFALLTVCTCALSIPTHSATVFVPYGWENQLWNKHASHKCTEASFKKDISYTRSRHWLRGILMCIYHSYHWLAVTTLQAARNWPLAQRSCHQFQFVFRFAFGYSTTIHLIPKWRPINYSFVCMLISPWCLVSM